MTIAYLADHAHAIPTLARWHQAQWSYLNPSRTVEQRAARLQQHLGFRQIPTTFVALVADMPVGCASLVEYDMSARMDLSPWLASVYVEPEYRRQGIGAALVRRVAEEAQALNVKTLYLYTSDKERFYARLGWAALDRCLYRGYPMVVMALDVMRET